MEPYHPSLAKAAGTYWIQAGASFYIGSTTGLGKRIWTHRAELKAGDHPNKALQAAYDAAGTMEAYLLTEVPRKRDDSDHDHRKRLQFHEQLALDEHFARPGCTNESESSRFNSNIGRITKANWQQPEFRAAQLERLKTQARNPTPEARAKMAKAKTGAANPMARPCTILHNGETLRFPACRNAAQHFGVTAQAMDNWLSGASPWPGQGKRKPRPQNRHLAGITGAYDKLGTTPGERDTTTVRLNRKVRVFKVLRQSAP